ncbi:MAG: cytochrome c family protein [Alphaproteobacteria bacterium]
MRSFRTLIFMPLLLIFLQPAFADDAMERGAELFKNCAACHSLNPGSNRTGPSLYNIVGQKAGQMEGYRYSNAMREQAEDGLVWTEENLHTFIEKPRRLIRMTKMAYPGLEDEADRAAVIEYLKAHGE